MFAFFTAPSASRLPLSARPSASTAPVLDLPALVGAAAWARLPAAVQRRFGTAHADVTYQGHLDMRCSAIGHVYAALARLWGGPLTHLNTTAVPTTVRVSSNGCGGVVWERRFHADATGRAPGAGRATHAASDCRTVRSTKELGADGGLLERTDGGLAMSLDVLEEDGALVFRSRRFWWVVGGLRVAVPALLTPGTCTVAHTDLGGGLFRFTLSMDHPWWGETFYQSGVFVDPHTDSNDHPGADTHTHTTPGTPSDSLGTDSLTHSEGTPS
ncbi:MAG: DUF4166 domain-containing protein [Gammaproteobacteria bacterium]|nr:DUF4166 domain-containing protein [Gammaproteobacteria bacterium]MBU1504361.1 DUF4166 domain-containing protein [Gammaproteobacteria bacterium]MBU2119037.1 DUF4166 domain-containing protein [Gammaproteobacteria bacterium]MBU2171740.1 DUF4166 domain-containing protein [Gammaproteobacteria bacterium]MBU2201119.1 DUF4166 domain-containing protein [Gammaproteobacteria bacterium]